MIYENAPKNNYRTDISKIKEQLEQGTTNTQTELPECSVLYRADTLKDEELYCRKLNKTWHILKNALESCALYYNGSPICSSITANNVQSLDSIEISNKSFEKTQKEIVAEKTRRISGHTAFYKLSRWSLIKKYILATLVLLSASFFGLSLLSLGGTAKFIVCAVCALAVVFVCVMLAINLLFKWIAKAEIGI